MKSFAVFVILALTTTQSLAEKCPTCRGADCRSEDVPFLECLPNLARGPFKALQHHPRSSPGEFRCLALDYNSNDDGILEQCVYVQEGLDVCKELENEVSVNGCSVLKSGYFLRAENPDCTTTETTGSDSTSTQSTGSDSTSTKTTVSTTTASTTTAATTTAPTTTAPTTTASTTTAATTTAPTTTAPTTTAPTTTASTTTVSTTPAPEQKERVQPSINIIRHLQRVRRDTSSSTTTADPCIATTEKSSAATNFVSLTFTIIFFAIQRFV